MVKIVENALVIYTDGSLKWRGRKGGYGIVFVHFDDVGNEVVIDTHQPPGIIGTTGNRMELQAVIDALRMASDCACYNQVNKVVIRTDSRYVTENHMTAVFQWSKSGWKNREGKPVDNADLWKDFVRAFRGSSKRTELEWVKGHGRGSQKDPHNYAADKLADASARSPLSRREYRSSVRRKVTPHKTMVGSIEACGQTIVVHIVETVWLKVQRTWKYRCEVMSAESPDYQQMDWLYSDHQMRDGHYYEVTLNDNPKNPMIVAVLREVVSDARERAVSGTQSTPR